MRTTTTQRLSNAVLATLLLIPAVPLTAAEPAPEAGFRLELQAALEAQGSTFALNLVPLAPAASDRSGAVELSPSELRAAAWSLDEDEDRPAAESAPEKSKGFGRWLKKRWYVPLLAAAAIGVAIDSGGDNDASGEDD